MYGLYNGSQASESLLQGGLTRHMLLQVNCGTRLNVGWNPGDCSGMAAANPNLITAGSVNSVTPMGIEGGPHFVMSPETPDGAHTYGLEFFIITNDPNRTPLSTYSAQSGVAGFDITMWCLVANTQSPKPNAASSVPYWACLQTLTGVNSNVNFEPELYHSFDINSQAIRFQIGNLSLDPATNSKSLIIGMAEL